MKTYNLSSSDIWKLARLCRQEQGTEVGLRAEMSLILNRYEAFASNIGIVDYVIKSRWWSRAEHWMNNGTAFDKDFDIIKDVLSGNRFFPANVDEHDCLSDIKKVSNEGVEFPKKDKSNYLRGITKIENVYGSRYTFWCFPDKYCDPFGYTGEIKMPTASPVTAEKVLSIAKSWLGKNEADGSHREIIDIYNAHEPLARGYKVKYTDAWCATFVSAVAIKAGATDIIPLECGCEEMIEKAKKMGIWVEDDKYVPTPMAIIMYDWQDSGIGDDKGVADHTGFVEKVTASGIMTIIEGNRNDSVSRRTISVNSKYIRGYIVPKYDIEVVTMPESKYQFEVSSVYLGATGNHVLLLAEILKARKFYNLGLAPNMVCDEHLVKAINAYQDDRRKHGVELGTNGKSDSVCGKKMWADILAL